MVKNLPAMQEIWVRSLGWEVLLEKEMATYSSILPWRIPWREEPGELQVTESQRVRHFWGTNTYTFFLFLFKSTSISIREGIGNPLQYSSLENPMERGVWWAMVHRVAKSQNGLKRLSTHASCMILKPLWHPRYFVKFWGVKHFSSHKEKSLI